MKPKTINTLNEYINFIGERQSILFKSVFRGQSDFEWKLTPSFYRIDLEVYDNSTKEVIPNYSVIEKIMLAEFYQKGVSLLKSYDIKNDLDIMVVGQHHGLPTRLLDWTENPLYALFFAVEKQDIEKDACVFEYMPTKIDEYTTIAIESNFKSDKYWFVSPRHINERVKAQNGFFTLHPLYKKLEIKSFDEILKEHNCEQNIDKIIIPKDKKESIRKELDKLNINRFTIYPDLDGLASKIKGDLLNLPFMAKGKRYVASK